MAERFFDTKVLLYLLSADAAKADRVEETLATGATISVQVLNEFASVAMRKLGMQAAEVRDALEPIIAVCQVVPLTVAIHQSGLQLAERYRFSFYDALIVAAAIDSGCTTLVTEDLQNGQVIADTLTIRNPFG
ncbi:MAG: PIN domain-containing protein [Betaproteobacteria bacterium]|nr:PIN domain-containing protein [Betaproteobacteria bacterium]